MNNVQSINNGYLGDAALGNTEKQMKAEIERLTESLSGIKSALADTSGNLPDETDQSAAKIETQLLLQQQKHLTSQIFDLEKALRLIASGEYGFCEECEDDIERKRLEKYPAVTLCFTCASINEQKHQHYR